MRSGLSNAAGRVFAVVIPVLEARADDPLDFGFIDLFIQFPDDGDR